MSDRRPGNFFSRRWRGEVSARALFWRDLLTVGTTLNILATFLALLAASQGVAPWVAVAIHFAPLPYNLFLVAAVHRLQPRPGILAALSLVWLVAATIL